VLKAADLLAECGLRHAARLGRHREVAQLRDRYEAAQMTNLHTGRLCSGRSATGIDLRVLADRQAGVHELLRDRAEQTAGVTCHAVTAVTAVVPSGEGVMVGTAPSL
jgi:hypothetical protein